MTHKLKLVAYLVTLFALISLSLYAGRDSFKQCDKCNPVIKDKRDTALFTGMHGCYPVGIKP